MSTDITISTSTELTIDTAAAEVSPLALYLAPLAKSSQATQARRAAMILNLMGFDDDASPFDFPWHLLTPAKLTAIVAAAKARYSPSGTEGLVSVLRGIVRACNQIEDGRGGRLIAPQDMTDRLLALKTAIRIDVDALDGQGIDDAVTKAHGRMIEHGELRRMFAAVDAGSPKGARDTALLACLTMGLRRTEITMLRLKGYRPESQTLTILGKRGKTRTIMLSDDVAAAVDAWLRFRGLADGYLICKVDRWGNIDTAAKLTGHGIAHVTQSIATAAGIDDIKCHDFRRTAATNLLRQTDSNYTLVGGFLGHESEATTKIYDLELTDKSSALGKKIHIPS